MTVLELHINVLLSTFVWLSNIQAFSSISVFPECIPFSSLPCSSLCMTSFTTSYFNLPLYFGLIPFSFIFIMLSGILQYLCSFWTHWFQLTELLYHLSVWLWISLSDGVWFLALFLECLINTLPHYYYVYCVFVAFKYFIIMC
jgi:hypothetical protein